MVIGRVRDGSAYESSMSKAALFIPPFVKCPFFKEKNQWREIETFYQHVWNLFKDMKRSLGISLPIKTLSYIFFSSSSVNFHLFEFIYNDLPLIKSTFSSPYQTSFIQKQQWKFSQIVGSTWVYVCVCEQHVYFMWKFSG